MNRAAARPWPRERGEDGLGLREYSMILGVGTTKLVGG